MGDKTAIEWTDATWNPIRARNLKTGRIGWFCTHVTEGCANCYAEDWNMRLGNGIPYKPGHLKDVEIFLDEKTLEMPLRWKRPRKIFVCSMTDLFADFVPDTWISRMLRIIADAPQHKFQILTKRPARMREWGLHFGTGHKLLIENVWLGVSVEDQAAADERIPILLATGAAKRWLSCEPLLGPVDIGRAVIKSRTFPASIDWVVVGGESGPRARPMHPNWARSLRDECHAVDVPFLFKQWGEYRIAEAGDFEAGKYVEAFKFDGDGQVVIKMGKRRAGRLLDGVEHNGYPT